MTTSMPHITAAPPHASDVVARVLALPGLHTTAIDALLSLASVEWSRDIPTACVECIARPRLLLNPEFIARHCHTAERLAMLVLHELTHVMLGHTRLFPRPTRLHNIAFDAVINASILATLRRSGAPVHRYAALPTSLYDSGAAPSFLLRPPPGWPTRAVWQRSRRAPASLRAIHRRLYATGDASALLQAVTYGEIIEALRGHAPGAAPGDDVPLLLGAHGTTDAEREALQGARDATAGDVLSAALAPLRGMLAGTGGALQQDDVRNVSRTPPLERALLALLRTAAHGPHRVARRPAWEARPVRSVHHLQDRRAQCRVHAARMLGAPPPLLFDGEVWHRRPSPVGVAIYVDVSGSMAALLPHLRRALRALQGEVQPVLHWFSTEVVPAQPGDLEHGRVQSTGGTSIASVLRHVVRTVPPRTPVVVLTDGHLEAVTSAAVAPIQAHGSPVHLGVIGVGPLHERAAWVRSSVRLSSHTE